MNDNILDDVVAPVGRKSIKDIPLPTRKKSRSKKDTSEIISKESESEPAEEIIDLRKAEPIRENKSESKNYKHTEQDEVDDSEIKIHHAYKSNSHSFEEDDEDETLESNRFDFKDLNKKPKNKKSNMSVFKFGVIIVVILAIIATFMSIFKSASLVVYSKNQKIQNSEILLEIENTISNSSEQILDYKEINLESVAEIGTESDSEEEVNEKASGIITVFNEYSKDPQKLIANTRFKTSDGKIYRIQESLTVPGYTENTGKITAGSIDAKVVADEAGDKFNIASAEFKIPGFEGQDQYDKFSAKTKTEISGGFTGIKKIIAPENLEIAKGELETRLKNNLKELAKNQISEDFILIENNSTYTFGSPEQKGSKGNEVTLAMKGFAKYLVINKKDLSKNIAFKNNGTNDNVIITNFDSIQITLIENEDAKQALSVKGDIDLKWEINEEQLKKDLSGKSKTMISEVVSKHAGIENIEDIIIRPYWSSKFPSDYEDIKVIKMI